MKKVAFCTLGCKVNQYETEAVGELFAKKGYEIVAFEEKADVYVINTCSVTSLSDRKSRQMIRRAKRLNPRAIVVAMGCYAQTAPEEVGKIEGINLVVGTAQRNEIVSIAEELSENQKRCIVGDIMHNPEFEIMSVSDYSERCRAYIKVQDGCNQFCSYCIIPYARGPIRSRNPEDVADEAKRLVEAGFREIVLVGIHIASYGCDLKEKLSLADLILKINETDGLKRIRLSSIEPMTLDEEFVREISKADKLCPHFHISLQSGCDETLKRMNRRYTTAEFEAIVDGLREHFEDVSITTDVMVGFAGETEEEFEKSASFCRKIGFADMHIFPYSRRKGTRADKMPDQIDPKIKQERSEKMFETAKKNTDEFLQRFIGRTMEVLFEQVDKNGYYEGKTSNYITVLVKSDKDLCEKFESVRLTRIDGGKVYGEVIV